MPIYEYACTDCRKIVSIFFRSMASQDDPACPDCGGDHLHRKISRVVIAKGGAGTLTGIDTSRLMGHYEGRDKRSQAAWARRVAGEMGEAGSEFKEMAEKVEAGQDVWDLYDPGPMLEHKVHEKSREVTGGGPEETALD